MDIINSESIIAGSVVLLGLFISIAYDGVVTKNRTKKKFVSALDYNWQKLIVSAR
jgi:hypothetical protein